jgi:hypothetical protein
MMDKETLSVLNDLSDAVKELASIVSDLNPGATNQLHALDFYLIQIGHSLERAKNTLERQ